MKLNKLMFLSFVTAFCPSLTYALNTQVFQPTPKNHEGLSNSSSAALEPGKVSVSVFGNYASNPLEFGRTATGVRVANLVDRVMSLDILAAVGIFPRVDFEVDLPLHFYNKIDVGTSGLEDNKNFTLGDIVLRSTITLKKRDVREEGPWGIGLIPFFTLPLNKTGDFLNQSAFTAGGNIVFDKWVNQRNYLGLTAGFRGRKQSETLLNLSVSHEILMGMSYVFRMSVDHGFDLLADVKASTTTKKPFTDEVSTPVEADLALRKLWKSGFAITVGGGRGLTNGYGAPDWRVFSGLTFQKPSHVATASMAAPALAPEVSPTPNSVPSVSQGSLHVTVRDEKGNPLPADLWVKSNGGSYSDQSSDSSWSKEVPAGSYHVTAQAPGYLTASKNVSVISGNPAQVELKLTSNKAGAKIEVLGKIMFDVDQATLTSESLPILDHVVEVLTENKGVKKVRIDAHTDAQGADAYNLDLSARRAKTVHAYLVEKGIEASRLETRGFGEKSPVATNKTPEGRSKNRRVEFVILDSDAKSVKTAK